MLVCSIRCRRQLTLAGLRLRRTASRWFESLTHSLTLKLLVRALQLAEELPSRSVIDRGESICVNEGVDLLAIVNAVDAEMYIVPTRT